MHSNYRDRFYRSTATLISTSTNGLGSFSAKSRLLSWRHMARLLTDAILIGKQASKARIDNIIIERDRVLGVMPDEE